MKKLIALLLVLTIAFALFGCTDKTDDGANNNDSNNGGGNNIGNTINGGNSNGGDDDGVINGPIVDIPMNYDGEMGVPISFIDKYNPDQFELVGGFNGYAHPDYEHGLICGTPTTYQDSKTNKTKTWNGPTVDGQTKYFRILIRHKKS